MPQHSNSRRILALPLTLTLAVADTPQKPQQVPPPIDPQRVQDQDDMTWSDYRAIPGIDWADPVAQSHAQGIQGRAGRDRFRRSTVRHHAAKTNRTVR
jgi:hypothetical protein